MERSEWTRAVREHTMTRTYAINGQPSGIHTSMLRLHAGERGRLRLRGSTVSFADAVFLPER